MTQKSIKAEIDTKAACRAALLEFAKDYEDEIVSLEAKLDTAEKPECLKVKHLDYGIYHFDECPPVKAIYIDVMGCQDMAFFCETTPDGCNYTSEATIEDRGFTKIVGNLKDIFDELEAANE